MATAIIFPSGGAQVNGLLIRPGQIGTVWMDRHNQMTDGEYKDRNGRYRPINPKNRDHWNDAERAARPLVEAERDRRRRN